MKPEAVVLIWSKGLCLSRLNLNRNLDLNSNWNNLDNSNSNGRIAHQHNWSGLFQMKTCTDVYRKIISLGNLTIAWRKARKDKTRKDYVIEFEKDLLKNLIELHNELKSKTYNPRTLQTFILRDPKTRKISKSHFRDRIVHHAIVNILEPIYEKIFIYDCCANRKGRGTLFALKRFDKFLRKVTKSGKLREEGSGNHVKGYCLKADIKHYFEEIDHDVLMSSLSEKIRDDNAIWLIQQVLENVPNRKNSGGGGEGVLI